jgi:hypothetical protein
MAGYKVIQDIEAEDKLVGPLTLKQFIFAGIFFVSGYLGFVLLARHVWFLALPLLPVMLVSGFLAFPWGRDQPTEIWLLAKLRFMLKPRRRIWDQSGIQELVTITAPKKVSYTNTISQGEVKSRLKALAETIDTRGWAIKDANVNLSPTAALADDTSSDSDRLVGASTLPKTAPISDVVAADDMMDEKNNPTAEHLNQMIADSSSAHRQETLQRLDDIRESQGETAAFKKPQARPDFWFMNQPDPSMAKPGQAMFGTQTVLPGTDDDDENMGPMVSTEEKDVLNRIKQSQQAGHGKLAYGNTRVVLPISQQKKPTKAAKTAPPHHKHKAHTAKRPTPLPPPSPPVTPPPDPAIINLANNDDLSVATIAREANKEQRNLPPGEVVISLH